MRRVCMMGLVGIVVLGMCSKSSTEPAPVTGWTTHAKVVSVYDGDTITVEVTRRMRVRILDCWASEVRTRDKAEKARGIAAREHLRTLLPAGSGIVLQIPNHTDIGKSFTFGRVLGQVWTVGGKLSIAEQMVAAGHATPTKQ